MSKTIEFYFDFGSPTAYLAHKRLQQLQSQYSCTLDYKPILEPTKINLFFLTIFLITISTSFDH